MKPGTVHDGLTTPILKFPMETLRQPLRDKTRDLLDRFLDPRTRTLKPEPQHKRKSNDA